MEQTILVWSAYLTKKGLAAMEKPFGPLLLEEEMLEQGLTPGSQTPSFHSKDICPCWIARDQIHGLTSRLFVVFNYVPLNFTELIPTNPSGIFSSLCAQ